MKPELRQITTTPQSSFLVRKDIGDQMLNNWHYHPEIELLYIKRSTGTWIIGDHIGPFQSGDMVLIGANLPHCFRHEYENIIKKIDHGGETICIKFEPSIFGSSFFSLPETMHMRELLSTCNYGLKLFGKTRRNLAITIDKMLTSTPGRRLIFLLSILEEIAESKEYITLCSKGFLQLSADTSREKIKLVFEYTFMHYNERILLGEVASLLNMTKQSFCRYFKTKTRKTYIEFLMEVRIGHACRLLIEDEKNVAEVSFETGYNNISHFNHQFKTIIKSTPLKYKKDYLETHSVS